MPNNNDLEPKGRNDGHEFDYSIVNERVVIGSDLCKGGVCKIHGEEFKTLGVAFELNLSQENNELPPKDMETGYLWLPVVDGHAPSQTQLDIGTAAMEAAIKDGKKVYVHCRNGHGRSPTVVIAYLVRFGGMTLDEARSLVQERRPEVHIEESQEKALREFSQRWLK